MMKRGLIFLLGMLMMFTVAVGETTTDVPLLEVHQMNLGFADGYYIRCGDFEMMIDGGKPVPFSVNDDVPRTLRELGADKLDVYIITHWHLDHCENVNVVLGEFGTEDTVVYSPSVEVPEVVTHTAGTLKVAPLAAGTYRQMCMGDVLEVGGMTITCIGPETLKMKGCTNTDSLNFVLQYGTRRFLFTGDFAQSKCINGQYKELCSGVDVLKFPHHGGQPYEIGNKAARTVNPSYVLVPGVTGKFRMCSFMTSNGVDYARENTYTSGDGHVVILTDGGEYFEVKTDQNPADYATKAN